MGILVYAPLRGQGYGYRSLELLLYHAFIVCGVERLHNYFEDTRADALAIHEKSGFSRSGEEETLRFGQPVRLIHLMLTREEYLQIHPEYAV